MNPDPDDYAARLGSKLETICEVSAPTAYGIGKARGEADERARCIKVLEDLLEDSWITEKRTAFRRAIAALSEAPTPPVASSPRPTKEGKQ